MTLVDEQWLRVEPDHYTEFICIFASILDKGQDIGGEGPGDLG